MTPKVSVATTTYNHARYIKQTVESVMMQQTDFPFEMVVGEDCSTDQTRAILLDLQARYGQRLRLLLHEQNIGRRQNFYATLGACRGEYIALVEGDDYWTSPAKLQKQADFLDVNGDCALCFHPVQKLYEAEGGRKEVIRPFVIKPRYTLEDLLQRNMIDTCSVMYRNHLFEQFPPWFDSLPSGDWPLYILNALHGEIGYLDEVMAVYRIHTGGVWSTQARRKRMQRKLTILRTVKPALPANYRPYAAKGIVFVQLRYIYDLLRQRQFRAALQRWRKMHNTEEAAWPTILTLLHDFVNRKARGRQERNKNA
jgi:glycosyltransferase involved in cell wall biosynthesis